MLTIAGGAQRPAGPGWLRDRTLFQEGRGYDPHFDLRTDAAIVYGVDDTLPERVAGWRARGYRVHLMTGLAWGHYQDYLLGRWDGREHWDEAQCLADGRPKLHGPEIPYMVPSDAYGAYLEGLLGRAIQAGVEAVYLEEPEFWSYTGYGPGFERAWSAFHGRPWRDPASDPWAFVQAAEVKYALYRDLLARLCRAVKRLGGGRVPCYLATHSLLNYTAWGIVGPELGSRAIPECDGAVVQVWSFTARSQTYYQGRRGERLFAVAFLEYGSGLELARGTDRHLWFLADPVEDSPGHGWDRYRAGYRATLAASLLHPEVGAYEVMPWPSRVFTYRYPRRPEGPPGDLIPPDYAAELLTIANMLAAMPEGPLEWDCGTPGLGLLVADTMLLRRGGPGDDDQELSSFYGLALPLVLAGMPARPVGMELLAYPGPPAGTRVLLLSYDGMTPPSPECHQALAAWVRAGGALLCFGPGDGPYETMPGWWNDGQGGSGPWPDLFRLLGLDPAQGLQRAGDGLMLIEPESPVALARRPDGAEQVRRHLRTALAALGPTAPAYRERRHLALRRGPYLVAANLAEAPGAGEPLHLPGRYVDLFDGGLPLREGLLVAPGDCTLAIDLARPSRPAPCVLAAAARIAEEHAGPGWLRFRAAGPQGTTMVARLLLPDPPRRVLAEGREVEATWDADTRTALLRHENAPQGLSFLVEC